MIDDDILVIDDFLTPSYHKNLKQTIEDVSFKWKYLQNVSYNDNEGTLNDYGFSHTIFNARTGAVESEYGQFFEPFMFQVCDTAKCKGALRCRVDMVTHSSKEEFIHEPHVDFIGRQNVSSVYYVNDRASLLPALSNSLYSLVGIGVSLRVEECEGSRHDLMLLLFPNC